MAKEIKAFITRDDFVNNTPGNVSPIFELSEISLTYSKNKQQYYYSADSKYSLYVFKLLNDTSLLQTEVDSVIKVATEFTTFLTSTQLTIKQQLIASFISNYNLVNTTAPVTDLNYNTTIDYQNVRSCDYITFIVSGVNASIWLSDETFKSFYPDYEISPVLPFSNFSSIINSPTAFITALDSFNPIEFNNSIELNKNQFPTTFTKMINIPYRVPNTSIDKNCYFAFNIYGKQGNYDYVLKLELYNYLVSVLGLDGPTIELLFPTILNINEFFVTPQWSRIALSSQVGQNGINSQLQLAYSEPFTLNNFIKVYNNINYLRDNTYSVPYDYNNLMLYITNGYYTEAPIKDFKQYYGDIITVTSIHPDFARMSAKTQRFITLISNMLQICDSSNSTEFFNKLIQNQDYVFTIINRGGVTYLSIFYDKHQYYVIPRYAYLNLM